MVIRSHGGMGTRYGVIMIAERFSFDDGNTSYDGLHDPEKRWNGWACPWFPLGECVRILETVAQWEDESPSGYRMNGDVLEFNRETSSGDEWLPLDGRVVDGVEYFPVGAWGWVWDEFPRSIMLADGTCNKCGDYARDCVCE